MLRDKKGVAQIRHEVNNKQEFLPFLRGGAADLRTKACEWAVFAGECN
jgi:hypothetical protein